MSGILKMLICQKKRIFRYMRNHKRKMAYIAVCGLLSSATLYGVVFRNYWLDVVSLIILSGAVINAAVYKKSIKQVQCFLPYSRVRNVDCLIIGDICDADKLVLSLRGGKAYVSLMAPGRTLMSSYEILRHTFSILKEESPVVIITVQKNKLHGGYTIFDLPVFMMSPTSMKRLGLEKLKKKEAFPILFYPFSSLKMLINKKKDFAEEWKDVPEEMKDFCRERGIVLYVLTG